MLMYQSPAANWRLCSGVNVACPVIGLSTGAPSLVSETSPGAFLPGSAGPWNSTRVTGLDRSLKVIVHVTTRVSGSYVRSAIAYPSVCTAGTSWPPVIGTLNDTAAACADVPQAAHAGRIRIATTNARRDRTSYMAGL